MEPAEQVTISTGLPPVQRNRLSDREARMSAALLASRLLTRKPLFLDTETTGVGQMDEVIEISIVDADGTVVLDTLVKPTILVSSAAAAFHGITNAELANAPTFDQLLPQLCSIIDGRVLIIYNADFDLRLLEQSARAVGLPISAQFEPYCAMNLYAQFRGEWNPITQSYRWQKLGTAAAQCNIKIPDNLHRARSDAEATRLVIMRMADHVKNGELLL